MRKIIAMPMCLTLPSTDLAPSYEKRCVSRPLPGPSKPHKLDLAPRLFSPPMPKLPPQGLPFFPYFRPGNMTQPRALESSEHDTIVAFRTMDEARHS